MKFVPIEKQSKKNQKAHNAKKRHIGGVNTGPRTMKTVKKPTRAMQKDAWKKGKEKKKSA